MGGGGGGLWVGGAMGGFRGAVPCMRGIVRGGGP